MRNGPENSYSRDNRRVHPDKSAKLSCVTEITAVFIAVPGTHTPRRTSHAPSQYHTQLANTTFEGFFELTALGLRHSDLKKRQGAPLIKRLRGACNLTSVIMMRVSPTIPSVYSLYASKTHTWYLAPYAGSQWLSLPVLGVAGAIIGILFFISPPPLNN